MTETHVVKVLPKFPSVPSTKQTLMTKTVKNIETEFIYNTTVLDTMNANELAVYTINLTKEKKNVIYSLKSNVNGEISHHLIGIGVDNGAFKIFVQNLMNVEREISISYLAF